MPAEGRVIGIVGPSKSGKSTLQQGLTKLGYTCRHIAQEHSFVPNMWQIIGKPDVLVFLDVSYEKTIERGQPAWEEKDYFEEIHRLKQAKDHADYYLHTDGLSGDEVLSRVLEFLKG